MGKSESKYSPLGEFLKQLKEKEVVLKFSEIEKILGFSLPQSAKTHRAWWANDKTHTHAVAGWLSAGWITGPVDFKKETAVFRKIPLKDGKIIREGSETAKEMSKSLNTFPQIEDESQNNISLKELSEIYIKETGRHW